MKTLNLNALDTACHTVIGTDGKTHRVRQVTGRVANLIAKAEDEEGLAKMTLYYDAVALLVPTLTRDEVDDLTVQQCVSIVTMAGTEVDAVNEAAAAPNVSSPTPEATPGALAAT
jgi:hypothetical protein